MQQMLQLQLSILMRQSERKKLAFETAEEASICHMMGRNVRLKYEVDNRRDKAEEE